MKKGYIVANLKIENAEGYEAYRSQVRDMIERHGGNILVRGGQVEVREGTLERGRVIVIEFESMDAARAFYESPEYQEIVPIRQRNADGLLFLVEGADSASA
jgi:uncharacterized protein (DUF1330 family)